MNFFCVLLPMDVIILVFTINWKFHLIEINYLLDELSGRLKREFKSIGFKQISFRNKYYKILGKNVKKYPFLKQTGCPSLSSLCFSFTTLMLLEVTRGIAGNPYNKVTGSLSVCLSVTKDLPNRCTIWFFFTMYLFIDPWKFFKTIIYNTK